MTPTIHIRGQTARCEVSKGCTIIQSARTGEHAAQRLAEYLNTLGIHTPVDDDGMPYDYLENGRD
jgi:hypothetical protein